MCFALHITSQTADTPTNITDQLLIEENEKMSTEETPLYKEREIGIFIFHSL